jgi:hypothetical protein
MRGQNKKDYIIYLLNLAPRHEDVWEKGREHPRVLKLGTWWQWSASRPILSPGEKLLASVREDRGWTEEPILITLETEKSLSRI